MRIGRFASLWRGLLTPALVRLVGLLMLSGAACRTYAPAPVAVLPIPSVPSEAPSVAVEADPEQPRPSLQTLAPGQELVVLVGDGDNHGTVYAIPENTAEASAVEETDDPTPPAPNTNAVKYTRGGLDLFASYLRVLRQTYGTQRVLYLHAGDLFQGSLESNKFVNAQGKPAPGAPMVQAFNQLGLAVTAVGNHEFDFGISEFNKRMADSNFSYLSANVLDKTTQESPAWPHFAQRILLQAGTIKVGVFGLSTLDTPTATRPSNVQGLAFTALREAALQQSQRLRQAGAQVVVLVAHAGLNCASVNATKGLRLRRATDPQGACGPQDEMVQLLDALPAGTVDAVVAGHTHRVVHHFVNQGGQPIPVIQAGHHGQFFNVIYLVYDTHKQQVVTEATRIEGPIPVCERVFANQRDCNGTHKPPPNGRGPLLVPQFRGQRIVPDLAFRAQFAQVRAQLDETSQRVVGRAAQALLPTGKDESPLGNLSTDAMRTAIPTDKADVALANAGSLRAPLFAGPITYGDVFRAFPFDNALCVLDVTGLELKDILRRSHGKRPFALSGATVEFISAADARLCNVRNGTAGEADRLYRVTLWDGRIVEDRATYKLALADFLVEGGSRLGDVITQPMKDRKRCYEQTTIRDAVVAYLEKQTAQYGSVNSLEHLLVEPAKPRHVVVRASQQGEQTICP